MVARRAACLNGIGRRRGFAGIRPIEPFSDLRSVVRLIDDAFSSELSPQAGRTLRELRLLSRIGWILGPFLWMSPFAELLAGFVFVEGMDVVGNVTVARSRGGGPGRWVISNVAVDPEYQGRGIGRALVEKAVSHVRQNRGRHIALQVRGDNTAAVHLYRDMGFRVVDAVLEMHLPLERVKPPGTQEGSRLPNLSTRPRGIADSHIPLRQRSNGEWPQEYALAQAAIPTASQHLYPLHQRRFRNDWDERLLRWLRNQVGDVREHRLGIGSDGALSALLTVWAGRWRPDHRLEIMVHPCHRGKWEEALVDHALAILRRSPPHPVHIEVFAVHGALVDALEARGFVVDRQLDQMELDIASAT